MKGHRGSDPYLDSGMEGFIRNTARREHWRVSRWCDLDDLIQEGYVCYCRCREKYCDRFSDTPTKEERMWMQTLVRTTFERHIRHNLAGKIRYGHEMPASQLAGDEPGGPEAFWEHLLPAEDECATLRMLIMSAPEEVAELMVLLASDAAQLVPMRRSRLRQKEAQADGPKRTWRTRRRKLRETNNEYYCRLLGLDPDEYDLVGMIQEHFGSPRRVTK